MKSKSDSKSGTVVATMSGASGSMGLYLGGRTGTPG